MMSYFKVEHKSVDLPMALKFADELEAAIGEIANGNRKASKLPMEPIVGLCQFVRNMAEDK